MADVLSIGPSAEQTEGLWENQCLNSTGISSCRSKSYVLPLV